METSDMSYAEKREGKLTGHWYGEVFLKATGERFRRRFETKKEAKGYEAYVRAAGVEPANLKDAKLGGPTFREHVILMRATRSEGRDPSGSRRLDFLVERWGHLTIPAITTARLDELVADLERRPAQITGKAKISDGTINRYLSAFSGVVKFARARPKETDVVISAPVIPWRKEAGKRVHWFSDAQVAVVVPYMQSQGWMAEALSLRVLQATGMRWGELEGLEAHQCQPEWIKLDETKTDTPRDVPIDDVMAQELKAMVVTGTIPKYWLMRTHLKHAVKACGFSPKLGIHNARHGAATEMMKNGTAPPIVQKFLGHKSFKTTMKYIHVEDDDLMKAMRNRNPRRGELAQNTASPQVLPFIKSTG
jgi:integrase